MRPAVLLAAAALTAAACHAGAGLPHSPPPARQAPPTPTAAPAVAAAPWTAAYQAATRVPAATMTAAADTFGPGPHYWHGAASVAATPDHVTAVVDTPAHAAAARTAWHGPVPLHVTVNPQARPERPAAEQADRAWPAGRGIENWAGTSRCTHGPGWYDYLPDVDIVRWYTSTAGHCRYPHMPDGYRTRDNPDNWITADTVNAWDPARVGWSRDVALYLAWQQYGWAGGWNPPPQLAGRALWEYCPGGVPGCQQRVWATPIARWTPAQRTGRAVGMSPPAVPAPGQLVCKTGQTTGTSCGVFQGYNPAGHGVVHWLDGCGVDGGDSGGVAYTIDGGLIRPVGMVATVALYPDPVPPECDGDGNPNRTSWRGFGYVPYFEITGWGGKQVYTW